MKNTILLTDVLDYNNAHEISALEDISECVSKGIYGNDLHGDIDNVGIDHNHVIKALHDHKTFILTILVPLLFGMILVIISGLFEIPLHDNIISLASNTAECLISNNILPRKQGDSMVLIQGHECSYNISYCTDNTVPVLNGLDFVQYFEEFKISDGVYNESEIGVAGTEEYSYVYNNYTFLFKSNENKEIFESAPEKYMPQVIQKI